MSSKEISINGNLSELTLAELFQFLAQEEKTGLLTFTAFNNCHDNQTQHSYLWFNQGEIIAAADCLDNKGLISLIEQRNFLSQRVVAKIGQFYPQDIPFGLYLKNQSILDSKQLRVLFYIQVMQQICKLFTWDNGSFKFQTEDSFPMLEMTGLSILGIDATLQGLRVFKDWSSFAKKMPAPESMLIANSTNQTQLPLNQLEQKIWEYANKVITIREISQKINLEVEKVQQIAFSLIMIGLAKEVPIVFLTSNNPPKPSSLDHIYQEVNHPMIESSNGMFAYAN